MLDVAARYDELCEKVDLKPGYDFSHIEDLDPIQLKALEMHGKERLIRGLAPDLPHIANPTGTIAGEELFEAALEVVADPAASAGGRFMRARNVFNAVHLSTLENLARRETSPTLSYVDALLRLRQRITEGLDAGTLDYGIITYNVDNLEAHLLSNHSAFISNVAADSIMGGSHSFMQSFFDILDRSHPAAVTDSEALLFDALESPKFRALRLKYSRKAMSDFTIDIAVRQDFGEEDPDGARREFTKIQFAEQDDFNPSNALPHGCPARNMMEAINWGSGIFMNSVVQTARAEQTISQQLYE